VAVIAVVALVYESGIVGGTETSPTASPTPTATKSTKSGGQTTKVAFKKYTVKDGDTLSAIAVKYDTTVNAILALNPDMSTSTLVVGTRIKVPKPSPSP
jgi:LysM repeat protein